MSHDVDELERCVRGWVGREHEASDRISAPAARILAATFDRDMGSFADGAPIPPAWHWLYFHEVVPLAATGEDGHARQGFVQPPATLTRRMWAGNRMRFERVLRIGDAVRRQSKVIRADVKSGSTGPLVFVTVRHRVLADDQLATEEEHDIVYRAPPAEGERPRTPPTPPEIAPHWQRRIEPSPVLLFRFSALTMNSHRIHYDRDYCTQREGYAGLLVHGPLTMLLMLDLFTRNRPQASLGTLSVRATAPLHDDGAFTVCGAATGEGTATLWASTPQGALAMRGEVGFSD